jgi:cell division transport system permease protein
MGLYRLFLFFLQEGFLGIIRHKTLSIFAIFIVSLSLYVLGFSRYLTSNINNLLTSWEGQLEIRLVLKDEVKDTEIKGIISSLEKESLVEDIKIISPKEAMEFMEKLSPSLKALSFKENENPLPYSLSLTLRKPVDVKKVKELIENVKRIPNVEEAIFDWEWMDKLKTYSRFLAFLGWLLFAALGVASLFTVTAITRILALSRKEEIAVLYSLGATPGSIRGPFVTNGILIGFISSIMALIFIFITHLIIRKTMADENFILLLLSKDFLNFSDQFTLLLVGTVMGAAGGFLSLGSIHDWRYSRFVG